MNLSQAPYKKGDKVRSTKGKRKGVERLVVFGTTNWVHVYVDGEMEMWPVEECERVTE